MKRFARLMFLLLSLGVAGCDHTTKLLAVSSLAAKPAMPVIPSVLELTAAYNTDSGFSLLGSFVPLEPRLLLLKSVATVGALLVLMFALSRWNRSGSIERWAFALLVGGALGNAIDRWRWGYVVDFIHVRYWPVFNVADIALTIGGALLLWTHLARPVRVEKASIDRTPSRPG